MNTKSQAKETQVTKMRIWIDADACPKVVKEVTFKAAYRLQIPTCLVANSYMAVPPGGLITSIQVEKGDDMADFYIAEHVTKGDLVITADIPLAGIIVEKEAVAINPRGELYTEENISERLSMRNFMKDLRDSGLETGGPPPFDKKDKEKFANSLDKILTKMLSSLKEA